MLAGSAYRNVGVPLLLDAVVALERQQEDLAHQEEEEEGEEEAREQQQRLERLAGGAVRVGRGKGGPYASILIASDRAALCEEGPFVSIWTPSPTSDDDWLCAAVLWADRSRR